MDTVMPKKKISPRRILETLENVEKFGDYLKNEECECEQPDLLCYVEKGKCSCGRKVAHGHCVAEGFVVEIGFDSELENKPRKSII